MGRGVGEGQHQRSLLMRVSEITARCTCSGSAAGIPLQVEGPECGQADDKSIVEIRIDILLK
jgi:hypothetical protein